jgi:hypothetical protein
LKHYAHFVKLLICWVSEAPEPNGNHLGNMRGPMLLEVLIQVRLQFSPEP